MNIPRSALKNIGTAIVAGALLLPGLPAGAVDPGATTRPGITVPVPDTDRVPRPDPRPLPCAIIKKSPVICDIAPVDPPVPVPSPVPAQARAMVSSTDALPPMVPGPYNPIPGPGDTPLPHDWLAA